MLTGDTTYADVAACDGMADSVGVAGIVDAAGDADGLF